MKKGAEMLKNFHETQILIASLMAMVSLFTYMVGPKDRIQLAHDVCMFSCAFLFGKFTNGFRKKEMKTREGDETAEP